MTRSLPKMPVKPSNIGTNIDTLLEKRFKN